MVSAAGAKPEAKPEAVPHQLQLHVVLAALLNSDEPWIPKLLIVNRYATYYMAAAAAAAPPKTDI